MRSTGDASVGRAAMAAAVVPGDLPGADLVASGIRALRSGEATVEALLVSVGAPRLRAAGLDIPPAPPLPHAPEISLYLAIGADHPGDAHSRYNALIRRLVSFERALERRVRGGMMHPLYHRDHEALSHRARHRTRQEEAQDENRAADSAGDDNDVHPRGL